MKVLPYKDILDLESSVFLHVQILICVNLYVVYYCESFNM